MVRSAWPAVVVAAALCATARGQFVAPPSVADIERWSRECLHVAADKWPVVDALHDDLIAALREDNRTGANARSAQRSRELEFLDAMRVACDADPACVNRLADARELDQIELAIRASLPTVRLPRPDAVLRGFESDPVTVRALGEWLAAARSLLAAIDANEVKRRDAHWTKPMLPAERRAALAMRAAIADLAAAHGDAALAAATWRWRRSLVGDRAEEIERTIVVLRNLRDPSPQELASAMAIANELEGQRDARAREAVDRILDPASDAPSLVASLKAIGQIDDATWKRIAAIRAPDAAKGDDEIPGLASVCRHWMSVQGFAPGLRAAVSDAGLAQLADFLRGPDGGDIEQTLDRLAWRDEAFGGTLVPFASVDVDWLRARVALDDDAAREKFDAAMRRMQDALGGRLHTLLEAGRAASIRRGGHTPADEEADSLRDTDAEAALDAAIAEEELALRATLMELARDDSARAQLALWSVDRRLRQWNPDGPLVGIGMNERLRTPLREPFDTDCGCSTDDLRRAETIALAAAIEIERLGQEARNASRAERRREVVGRRAAWEVMGRPEGAIFVDEEIKAMASDTVQRQLVAYPEPKRSSDDLKRDERSRIVATLDRLSADLPSDCAKCLRRAWLLRVFPEIDEIAERRALARLVAAAGTRGQSERDAAARARATADRAIERYLAARLRTWKVLEQAEWQTLTRDLQRFHDWMTQDAAIARDRLARDLRLADETR
ncbi:MAG: hypothetical protein U0572_03220 [Phycisphaerales bacterium]